MCHMSVVRHFFFQCQYWKVTTSELLELGSIFFNRWIFRTLEYQFHVKGIVLYFGRPLAVSKFELWFVIGYIVFPRVQWFSLCKDLHRYWPPERCIGGMTSIKVMFAWARSVGWGSNEVVIPLSCTLSKCYDVQYGNTFDSPHQPYSPFTQHITLCFLYYISILWALCQAVILLTYIVATKIGSCELDLRLIIHILGSLLQTSPICLMIMEPLAIFQAWIWVWVHIGKC